MLFLFALAASSVVDLNAAERAEGNRPAQAVQIGKALLCSVWPAQVLKIRVDAAGNHTVAGLMISGVKFHRRLDPAAFTAEVVSLVRMTFAASPVEEVDVWATIPLPPFKQRPVGGEYLIPTDRFVYGAAVPRSELATFAARLARGDEVFWDPAWRRTLDTTARNDPAQGAERTEAQS